MTSEHPERPERPERKGRQIAMSDAIDALIDDLARAESLRRRGRVTRADLVEEWALAAQRREQRRRTRPLVDFAA